MTGALPSDVGNGSFARNRARLRERQTAVIEPTGYTLACCTCLVENAYRDLASAALECVFDHPGSGPMRPDAKEQPVPEHTVLDSLVRLRGEAGSRGESAQGSLRSGCEFGWDFGWGSIGLGGTLQDDDSYLSFVTY